MAIALFVALCVLPVAWMLCVSFVDSAGGFTVRNHSRLFVESRQRQLMPATEAAARRVDGRLEEAALLVASRRRVLWRITLPLVAPSIVASALIVFVLAISEFGAPGLLRVNVFTTEVFTAFSAFYDFGAATALAIPLLAAALIAGTAAQFVIGERLFVTQRGAHSGLRLQRVAIARAIIAHPSLLLLDEPMSSLDAELKNDLMAELKSLQSALDATTVYITHDRAEALTMAYRVALMKNGKITQIAAPHESRGATAMGATTFD